MGKNVIAVAYSANGSRLATSTDDNKVAVWSDAGKLIRTLSLPSSASAAYAIGLSPDRNLLAAGHSNVFVFDVGTGKLRFTWEMHIDTLTAVSFSPNSTLLALATANFQSNHTHAVQGSRPESDFGVAIIDVATGKRTRTLPGFRHGAHGIEFSPDGKLLAVGGEALRVFDTKTWRVAVKRPNGGGVTFSPDSRFLYHGGLYAGLHGYDLKARRATRKMPGKQKFGVFRVSGDGKSLLLALDGSLHVRERTTGALQRKIALPKGPVIDVVVPANQTRALIGISKRKPLVVDIATGKRVSH